MKRILIVLISAILTMSLFLIGLNIIFKFFSVDNSYEISTAIKMENKLGVMSDYKINCEDCLNSNDEIEISVSVFGENERNVVYDILIIVNYKQVDFEVNDVRDTHYTFNTNNSKKEFTVTIDRSYFEYSDNDVLFIIRQDVEKNVCENDLLQDVNSICRRFSFVCKDSEREYTYYNRYDKCKEVDIETEDVFAIIPPNKNENLVINYYSNNTNYADLLFDLNGQYVVMGLCGSKMIQMENNKDYIYIELSKGQKAISFPYSIEKVNTLHELEFLCIPVKESARTGEVLTSRRYTLKAE